MLSIDHLSQCLQHVRLDGLAKEIGVTRFILVKIKSGDKTSPYNALQKVSDYFEGVESKE